MTKESDIARSGFINPNLLVFKSLYTIDQSYDKTNKLIYKWSSANNGYYSKKYSMKYIIFIQMVQILFNVTFFISQISIHILLLNTWYLEIN